VLSLACVALTRAHAFVVGIGSGTRPEQHRNAAVTVAKVVGEIPGIAKK